eukprot:19103-Heterococcus_DN1.PRE.2
MSGILGGADAFTAPKRTSEIHKNTIVSKAKLALEITHKFVKKAAVILNGEGVSRGVAKKISKGIHKFLLLKLKLEHKVKQIKFKWPWQRTKQKDINMVVDPIINIDEKFPGKPTTNDLFNGSSKGDDGSDNDAAIVTVEHTNIVVETMQVGEYTI